MKTKFLTCCFGLTITMSVVYPIWYVLLFAILARVHADPWMWAAYWCYIPAGIIGGILTGVATAASESED